MKINERLFPLILLGSYCFILLESYFYVGVLSRIILISSPFVLVVSVLSGALLVGKKLNKINELVFKLNTFVFLGSLLIYLAMEWFEAGNFHNYVFSQIHVQPNNFLYLVILSGELFVVSKLIQQKKFSFKASIVNILLGAVLLFVFSEGSLRIINAATYSDLYIIRNLTASYDSKMTERWGIYYRYMQFVKNNTSENSSILIPPQETPWLSTGNGGLDRYFLYPRSLGNGGRDDLSNLKDYDYVMLAWGEWNNGTPDSYGWPKIRIPAEEVVYFDPSTEKVSTAEGDYDPAKSSKIGVWGIIKVKR